MAELGISDHYAIFCSSKLNFSFKKNSHKSIKYRSFKHFDENAILTDLFAAPWNQTETLETANDALEAWNSIFLTVVDNHVPIRCHRIKNDVQPDWLTPDSLDKIKERDKLKKKKKKMGRFHEYKVMRNTVSDLIQESKRSSYKSKIEQGQDDPRSIWRIFKEFGASNKTSSDDEYFSIKQGEKVISVEFELAEKL